MNMRELVMQDMLARQQAEREANRQRDQIKRIQALSTLTRQSNGLDYWGTKATYSTRLQG
jgi:hypothetical protein